MATLQRLNGFLTDRLAAAAIEIFGAVEKTMVEYQEQISDSKQEIRHLRKLLVDLGYKSDGKCATVQWLHFLLLKDGN